MAQRVLDIAGVKISDDADCFVIAEIGHNHQGNVEKCKQLFLAAKECGVNAVKLQKRDNKSLYTAALFEQPYDNENSFGETYGSHREALEFNKEQYIELKKYAEELGLVFFATAFDFKSADLLEDIGVPAYKIASGDIKTIPLLLHIAKKGKPIILSTGGASLDDIKHAYHAIMPVNSQLALLQCTATYPTEVSQLNLRVIETFREHFPDVVVGVSDHFNGISMAPVAYLLGARIIEKHFTISHVWKGTDHAFSLEPIGMKKMVRDLQRIRIALGDGEKKIFEEEKKPIAKMSKMLVASQSLMAEHVIVESDIAMKSPGLGLHPSKINQIIGKKLLHKLETDEPFLLENLQQ